MRMNIESHFLIHWLSFVFNEDESLFIKLLAGKYQSMMLQYLNHVIVILFCKTIITKCFNLINNKTLVFGHEKVQNFGFNFKTIYNKT